MDIGLGIAPATEGGAFVAGAIAAVAGSPGGILSGAMGPAGVEPWLGSAGDAWIARLEPHGGVRWQKALTTTDGLDWFTSVAATSDGGAIAAGGIQARSAGFHPQSHPSQTIPWVVRFDRDGKVVWQRAYNIRLGRAWAITPITGAPGAGSGYIFSGWGDGDTHDGFLVRLDEAGEPMWNVELVGDSYEEVWSVREREPGDFVFAGFTNERPRVPTEKLSAQYDLVIGRAREKLVAGAWGAAAEWSHLYGTPWGWEAIFDMDVAQDGGVVLAGQIGPDNRYGPIPSGAAELDAWILKLRPDPPKIGETYSGPTGDVEWSRRIAFDINGSRLFGSAFSISDAPEIDPLTGTPQSRFIVAGRYAVAYNATQNDHDAFVLQLDRSGALIPGRGRVYRGSRYERFWSVRAIRGAWGTGDGSAVLTGFSSSFNAASGNDLDAWVVFTNPDGGVSNFHLASGLTVSTPSPLASVGLTPRIVTETWPPEAANPAALKISGNAAHLVKPNFRSWGHGSTEDDVVILEPQGPPSSLTRRTQADRC